MVVAACICGYTKTTDLHISIKLLKKITDVRSLLWNASKQQQIKDG